MMMKVGCGFAVLSKWLFSGSVSSVSSCVYLRLSTGGPASRALDACGGMPRCPPDGIAQSVLAFGTHSWNVCIRKQLGLRGTLQIPPDFLLSVTFSSGFSKTIP